MSIPWFIDGILADLEGTCINMELYHAGGFSLAAASYGMKITVPEILQLEGYVGAGDRRAIQIILNKFGRQNVDQEEFRLRKMEFYRARLRERPAELRPGFLEFCKRAKERGLPIAIASLTPREQAMELILGSGLNRHVSIANMIFLEDVRNIKPDPEVFEKAAARISTNPRKTLAFGDSVYDMQAATAAGSIPIAMPCNWTAASNACLTESGAAHIFRDWRTVNLNGLLDTVQS